MRWLIAGVALSALWTHVGTRYAAELFARPERAWEHLQYISKGFDAVLLYGAIVYLAARAERRRTWALWWLTLICLAGAFAQLMTGVCGIGYWQFGGLANNLVGLCYVVHAWAPVALVTAAVILAGASYALGD